MEQAFSLVKQLVDDFRSQEAAYLAPEYQESQVRLDFIDKFFTALGWDVSHTRQKNPYEQEVKIENRVRTEGSQRFADYAFFTAPNFRDVKFFVEAKKPAHDLLNPNYYHQAIRYGWNQKTPIAVLTDFEEFHILDCRFKPDIKTALDRKIEVFRYTDYADEETFKKISFLFGRDAVANGSLEKYAEKLPKPRGKAAKKGIIKARYQQVDEAFLELLDGYRDTLAHSFKNKNAHLDGETLTEAVQRTLDRLVFIRFLEDKGIEEKMIIGLRAKPSAWKAFLALCRSLEPKYNGLVFKQHPVIDSDGFTSPDDETFADICNELADPASPYDFNSIPISILGSIYERFLGKVVTTTDKRARVIEKPEVRKAGGVYYTPEYIVRYIVGETLGKLLYEPSQPCEGSLQEDGGQAKPSQGSFRLTPAEVAKLKIADIACGSGSFLLEVYSQLLEYHTRYYNAFPEKAKKGDTEKREGKIVLSHKKRQEILVNNIYGVDIDFQATEVTQLSLYLKLMEDVTMNDAYQFSLLKERMLPDLRRNIVCGNSLIGRDILDGKLFNDETEHTLKPMNFEDAFPEIMNPSPPGRGTKGEGGGFDVIVGNPPYVQAGLILEIKEYLKRRFENYSGNTDLYVYFIEKAFSVLHQNGTLGMIVSNKWIRADYGHQLRGYLARKINILTLIDFGELPVFKNVGTFPCILIGKNRNEQSIPTKYTAVKKLPPDDEIENQIKLSGFDIDLAEAKKSEWTLVPPGIDQLLNKIGQKGIPLIAFSKNRIRRGVVTGYNPAFIIDKKTSDRLIREHKSAKEIIHPFVSGDETRRYLINWLGRYIIFTRRGIDIKQYPSILKHLTKFRRELEPKKSSKDKIGRKPGKYEWYEIQDSTAYYNEFEEPKIIYGQFQIAPHFSFSASPLYFGSNHYMIVHDDTSTLHFLCGILNSSLYFFYMKRVAGVLGDADEGGRVISQKSHIQKFPIRTINFEDAADKARHDSIVALVEQMLNAKEKHAAATTEAEKNRLDMQIESLDRQIDAAVYELYGLTEEEIKIVEGNRS